MNGFRDAVQVCGFIDLGFVGLPFTWDNRQQGTDNIKVRLDQSFANSAFLDLFNDVKVRHEQTTKLDHCCLVIECVKRQSRRRRSRHQFGYENMWHRDPSYQLGILSRSLSD